MYSTCAHSTDVLLSMVQASAPDSAASQPDMIPLSLQRMQVQDIKRAMDLGREAAAAVSRLIQMAELAVCNPHWRRSSA